MAFFLDTSKYPRSLDVTAAKSPSTDNAKQSAGHNAKQSVDQRRQVEQQPQSTRTTHPAADEHIYKQNGDNVIWNDKGIHPKQDVESYKAPGLDMAVVQDTGVFTAPVNGDEVVDDAIEGLGDVPKEKPNIWYEYLNGDASLFGLPFPGLVVPGERDLDKYIQMAQMKDPAFQSAMNEYNQRVKLAVAKAKNDSVQKQKASEDGRVMTKMMATLNDLRLKKKEMPGNAMVDVRLPDGTIQRMNGKQAVDYAYQNYAKQMQSYLASGGTASGNPLPVPAFIETTGNSTNFMNKRIQDPLDKAKFFAENLKLINKYFESGAFDREAKQYLETGQPDNQIKDLFDRTYAAVIKALENTNGSAIAEGERIRQQFASIPTEEKQTYNEQMDAWAKKIAKIAQTATKGKWDESSRAMYDNITGNIGKNPVEAAVSAVALLLKDNGPISVATAEKCMTNLQKYLNDMLLKFSNSDRPAMYRFLLNMYKRYRDLAVSEARSLDSESFMPDMPGFKDISDKLKNLKLLPNLPNVDLFPRTSQSTTPTFDVTPNSATVHGQVRDRNLGSAGRGRGQRKTKLKVE